MTGRTVEGDHAKLRSSWLNVIMVDDFKDFQAYGINDFSNPNYLPVHWFIIRTIN